MIFAGEALIARDPRTGRELWSIPWKTELAVNACDPIYHDGTVFLTTDYGKHAALFDVNGREPRQLWKESGSSFSSGILRDGFLYCFTGTRLSCLEFETGTRRWAHPEAGRGSLLLAGDKLILLSDKGQLSVALISSRSFTPILQTEVLGGTTWVPPALADGKLYVRNTDGDLVCLRIAKEAE
jgi:outer membrane protein assembly factor BamB